MDIESLDGTKRMQLLLPLTFFMTQANDTFLVWDETNPDDSHAVIIGNDAFLYPETTGDSYVATPSRTPGASNTILTVSTPGSAPTEPAPTTWPWDHATLQWNTSSDFKLE